ncbi:hypothetical protein A3Q56_00906 [Intoshia linei]|uniref:Adenosine kinase n=1 Tax=Intoshia linei TaxID=1819745 RepID=A0A177BCE4_9BILA|nr:hypothetical protein A3Q56_00906 [Intoshia linei]
MLNKAIFSFGHALMDVSAHVDQEFLEKYDLNPNSMILRGDAHKYLIRYEDLINTYDCKIISAQPRLNALSLMSIENDISFDNIIFDFSQKKFLLQKPHTLYFSSSIGNDKIGKMLIKDCEKTNIVAYFEVISNIYTGNCCVMISNKSTSRSLATDLGANLFTTENFVSSNQNSILMDKCYIFYITGYFFHMHHESITKYARNFYTSRRRVIYNISACFISMKVPNELKKLMQFVNVLVGNKEEFESFAKIYEIENNDDICLVKAIGEKLIFNCQYKLKIIMTRAEKSVIYGEFQDSKCKILDSVDTIKIKNNDIMDTNGAGDAFMGGFLSVYINEEDHYKSALHVGNKCANYIMKQCCFNLSRKKRQKFCI